MFERLRWPWILLPALVVGGIELLSDTLLDPYLPFPWDTLLVFTAVAALSAVYWRLSIDRLRLLGTALEQRNAELEQRNATARALHRVSVAITALADLEKVLEAVVEHARRLLHADVALLLMTGPDGELVLRAADGPPEAIDPTGSGPGPDALRFVDPAFARVQLAAPLQRGGQTIGLLFVGARTTRSFDVDDLETLSSLANQASIALENARLQGRLRELAVVAERERIAREMHDGLAQVLGYVNTKSQAVEHLLEAGRMAEARAQLAELAAAARSVYVDVREAILGLRSPITPERGLVGAIEEYAARFADASKLAASVEATDAARSLELAPDVEAQVFRILQESLTNVRKHALAHRVVIRLAVDDGSLVVGLEDDGRGFAEPGSTDSGFAGPGSADRAPAGQGAAGLAAAGPGADADEWPHYGLDAMRERAATIGATVEWSTATLGGTLVRLAVPLATPPGAARLGVG